MTEIHYWDASTTTDNNNSRKREQATKINEINNNFNKQIYDMMISSSGDDSLFDTFDMDIPDSLFDDSLISSDAESKLSKLKNDGMGKVWAAKMSSVLPFSDMDSGYGKDKDNNSMGGLSSIIELTVKMQVAQAKKSIQQLGSSSQMSFEEFIGNENKVEQGKTTSNENSRDAVIADLQSQIKVAASKYETSLDELQEMLFSSIKK